MKKWNNCQPSFDVSLVTENAIFFEHWFWYFVIKLIKKAKSKSHQNSCPVFGAGAICHVITRTRKNWQKLIRLSYFDFSSHHNFLHLLIFLLGKNVIFCPVFSAGAIRHVTMRTRKHRQQLVRLLYFYFGSVCSSGGQWRWPSSHHTRQNCEFFFQCSVPAPFTMWPWEQERIGNN